MADYKKLKQQLADEGVRIGAGVLREIGREIVRSEEYNKAIKVFNEEPMGSSVAIDALRKQCHYQAKQFVRELDIEKDNEAYDYDRVYNVLKTFEL